MKPVKFKQSNCTIGGEVPAHRARGMVLTRWAGCWWERVKFLLFGKLWLIVQGETMPPMLVTSDREFRIVNPPEAEVEVEARGFASVLRPRWPAPASVEARLTRESLALERLRLVEMTRERDRCDFHKSG